MDIYYEPVYNVLASRAIAKGRWLDRARFAIGANIRVLVTPRRLVLEVIESESAMQPASGSERFSGLAMATSSPPASTSGTD
jgi:hypothetical protein